MVELALRDMKDATSEDPSQEGLEPKEAVVVTRRWKCEPPLLANHPLLTETLP